MNERMLKRLGLFLTLVPFVCHAANSKTYEQEEAIIPKKPSAPPPLNQLIPRDLPHCERYFLFQGKKYECDSNAGRDADKLRLLVRDVPAALAELDIYQENREKLKTAAYVGTASVIAMVVGIIMSHPPFDPTSGAPRPGGYVMMGGLLLGINTLIYGFSVMKANESHLGRAVDYYNAAHPGSPIELQFSTQVNF